VRLCPNDFRAVSVVELLDALARVAGDFAERIDRVRQHARQNLHPIIGSSGLVGPLIAPATNYRPYFLGSVELRNPKLAKVVHDAVEPWRPVLPGRVRKPFVVTARLVQDNEGLKPARFRGTTTLDRFIV